MIEPLFCCLVFKKRWAFTLEGTSLARPSQGNSQDNILSHSKGETALVVDKTLRYLLAQSPWGGSSENTRHNCSHFQPAARTGRKQKAEVIQTTGEKATGDRSLFQSYLAQLLKVKVSQIHEVSHLLLSKMNFCQKLVPNLAVCNGQPGCFGIMRLDYMWN